GHVRCAVDRRRTLASHSARARGKRVACGVRVNRWRNLRLVGGTVRRVIAGVSGTCAARARYELARAWLRHPPDDGGDDVVRVDTGASRVTGTAGGTAQRPRRPTSSSSCCSLADRRTDGVLFVRRLYRWPFRFHAEELGEPAAWVRCRSPPAARDQRGWR